MSENGKETVASRKLAAAELRKARKAARDPRIRLLSDSSDEAPKGILKNSSQRIPTKRSVSECVDDLTQIMADLDLNIHDLQRKQTGKFCPCYHHFDEEEEDDEDDDDDDDDDDGDDNDREQDDNEEERENRENDDKNLKKRCDCNNVSGDSGSYSTYNEKPKKSVRFDEHVYEQVFFASRLYDRRFAKYHFSSRHHPQTNQQNKSKKGRKHSKSESDDETIRSTTSLKSENSYGCKMTKSQRAKQSKKDKKKKRLTNKKEEGTDTSSDDQGYCSSFHSFSD